MPTRTVNEGFPEHRDEVVITERDFADYALAMLESLTRLAIAQDRRLLARLLAIAAFEAPRLQQEQRALN